MSKMKKKYILQLKRSTQTISKHKVVYTFYKTYGLRCEVKTVECISPTEQVDKSSRYLGQFLEDSLAGGSMLLELEHLKS